jgi:WD40 repeat protein
MLGPPDGKILAIGTASTTKLWELSSGRELHTLRGGLSLAFSFDGNTLASGGLENELELWETASGRKLRTLTGHTDDVECMAFGLDGKVLVSGGGREIMLWGIES